MHARTNTAIRFFLVVIVFFAFLFFSNDFGLIDVQKTAIIIAVGIDRDQDEFIITSQVAVPKPSTDGNAANAVQIVSRGKTVAEAFDAINAKTGWYPKLVFCNLILLGSQTTARNVFEGLDYFLLDEYLSDNCLVAACDGSATDVLNAAALIDSSSSAAIEKVLSHHAEQVGTVRTSTLRTFAMDYYAEDSLGSMPVVKLQNQQEPNGESTPGPPKTSPTPTAAFLSETERQTVPHPHHDATPIATQNKTEDQNPTNKPVFSARETALFRHGIRVGTLTAEETFAYNTVTNRLRLAPYTVDFGDTSCALSFKQNARKIQTTPTSDGNIRFTIQLTITAGLLDYATPLPKNELADAGDVPQGVFTAAKTQLTDQIAALFQKTRAMQFDLFRISESLKRQGARLRPTADLSNVAVEIRVRFKGVR